jgi:Ribbon-helix-helix protein
MISLTSLWYELRGRPPKPLSASKCLLGLPKCVSIGHTKRMMKDSGFRIRVQRDLHEQFLEVCRTQDKPAAQVLREFMRGYVAEHGATQEVRPRRKGEPK